MRLHRDERGTISIVAVFSVMILTMLLGMVMNVGRQVDGKIRLQNSADATAYSGGVIITRGMNGLAYTNHLMCEIFALTAILREARDMNSASHSPDILAAWTNVAPYFDASGFPQWRSSPTRRLKIGFAELGPAITQKVPLEQEAIRTFSEWGFEFSRLTLPTMEYILREELIPKYQQSLFYAFPEMAQTCAMESARRNGLPQHGRGPMRGVLWRCYPVDPVGGSGEMSDPSLPVYDPATAPTDAVLRSRKQRNALANKYLRDWNHQLMYGFDHFCQLSQFSRLWRSYTCGYLKELLEEEYPDRNLPFVIRTEADDVMNTTAHLEEEFTFIGVAYWNKLPQMMPGVFKNPMDGDTVAFAEARVFVPHRRLVWHHHVPGGRRYIGGMPGNRIDFPDGVGPEPEVGQPYWRVGRQHVHDNWDLWNQHWTCSLVPATNPALVDVLQTQPPLPEFNDGEITLPSLGDLTTQDITLMSPH